ANADLPTWKKTILYAMAHYGMFVGDTTGGPWGIQVESDTTYTAFDQPGRFLEFARSAGFIPRADPALGGRTIYVGELADGVDWPAAERGQLSRAEAPRPVSQTRLK